MNKRDKMALAPKLRFPEFRMTGAWQEYTLLKIADKLTEKVGDRQLTTLSISAGVGFVSQAEKFSRDISGKQYENYILLKKGDFSYNKGNSKKFPQGCIYELKEYTEAAVPNAFISFRFHENHVSDFYKGYFENNFHGKQLTKFITSGARMDGLLNINSSDFFSIILPAPSNKEEQQKIADCLSSLGDLIIAEDKKLEALRVYKRGLMHKLFPAEGKTMPEWRFPEFRNSGEWETTSLGEICDILQGYGFPTEMQGKSKGKYSFYKVSDISSSVMDNGGLLLKAVNCIDDVELLRLRAKTIPKGTTVFAKIGEALRLNRRAISIAECLIDNNVVGIKAKYKSINDHFIFILSQLIDLNKHCGGVVPSVNKNILENIEIPFTDNSEEQQKIANCLSSVDDLITEQTKKIEALKFHKKGLMQGLFPSIEEVDE
jgi:type I restriction enzyme S subunit